MTEVLKIDREDNGVVIMTLNRPEHNNAIEETLVGELRDNLRILAKDESIRVLIITGAGENFCNSVEPEWVHQYQNNRVEHGKDPGSKICMIMNLLEQFPAPVIARVNGKAIGTGAGLAACCDIIICQKKSTFAFHEVKFGLAPIASAPHAIQSMGFHQARRWLISGETMTSDLAIQSGLAHILCDDDKLDETVNEQVEHLLKGAPGAQNEIKQWMKTLRVNPDYESVPFQRATGNMFRRCLASSEAKSGIESSINDSAPPWKV